VIEANPCCRNRLSAMVRTMAKLAGALPSHREAVSSSNTTSLTQWGRFSTCQCWRMCGLNCAASSAREPI
jgi:hypothetical protein